MAASHRARLLALVGWACARFAAFTLCASTWAHARSLHAADAKDPKATPEPKAAEPKATSAGAPRRSAQEQRTRDIYRELVETDTTQSVGDTLRAARQIAARLRAGGFPLQDVHVFETAPKRGNLVVRLHGAGKKKPLLLLAHLDVVEAKPEDWSTPPFQLVEKDGYFYGRGTGDDKYMAAVFVANLIRYRQEHFQPDRDLILALTTDEEISDRYHYGINWLIKEHRDLIDAEFALNEGGGVGVKDGKPIWNSLQQTEKVFQNFWLSVTNSGGHSSQPRKDNAIYTLARGLSRLDGFAFPVQLNPTTRLYFERTAKIEGGEVASDIQSLLSAKPDPRAVERLSAKPPYNAQLRTTCVATRLEGGHADNALPQLARALVNCRILPSSSADEVQGTLLRVLADEQIKVSAEPHDVAGPPSSTQPDLTAAIERLTAEFWPGIPILPTMSAGATDGRFLREAGIPTYGHSGLASDIFDVRAHGKDERVSVEAFFRGQEYLYRLVKAIAGGPQ
ncbi:MAG TPA: M20/M25/M40 family metallo-hydrolase [Polyangiaceae bacterium]|nr:M20/M25/M40 family metallo-hydrolase [Polyangiaceae bacterium]